MSPLEIGGLTPDEITRLSKSVQSREQSPSTRQQTAEYANWRALADAPADPFNVERIPVNRLRQMRRDPMIGFGLHFIRTPIIRAPWYIRCEDAQIASFVDYALRRIYTRLVNQYMLSLDFGFSGIAKKFVQEPVKETYFDPTDVDQQESPDNFLLPQPAPAPSELQGKRKPVWSEGSVLPIIWKPFVPLPPEDVEVLFNNKGEFDGIKFTPRFQVQATGIGASKASNEGELEIDVYHALWITNERDSVFGNVFGYPRIGYATNYWWSYWHQHGLSDRHFEKDADPPTVVRHPQGNFQDEETGDTIAFRELALDIGDRVRAGSTIALPSEVYTSMDDRPSGQPKWDIDFLKGAGNFDAFLASFDYLNVMKLRSVWVPEQALIEGKGGQSSRNVAATFGDSFQESQGVLISEFDQHINQFIIPQLVALNFPEFEGKVEKVTRGFSNKDVETMRQLVQLTGQQDASKLPIDTRQMLEELGVPLLDIENQAANMEQAGRENMPGVVPSIPNQQAGTVPTPGQNGQQANPGSAFSYVQPPERINIPTLGISLADDFLSSLPSTPHYSDKIMRQYASQIWLQFNNLYKEMYSDYIDFMQKEDLNLADEPEWVKKLVSRWKGGNPEVWVEAVTNIRQIYRRALARAGKLSLNRAKLKADWDGDDNESSEWINTKINNLVTSVSSTINDDLTRSTAIAVRDLEDPTPESVATALKAHFAEYPEWQASRVARTEVRDIFNSATLLAGQSAGVSQVQAVDAQYGDTDEDCHDRDGEIFSIVDAFDVPEHPNGTLAWRLLASDNLTIEKSEDEQVLASYNPESQTVFLADSLSDSDKKAYLLALGGKLEHGTR